MRKTLSEPMFTTEDVPAKYGFFKALHVHRKKAQRRKGLIGASSMLFLLVLTGLVGTVLEAPTGTAISVIHTALSNHVYLVHNIQFKEAINWFAGLTPINLVQGFLLLSGTFMIAKALFDGHANASVSSTHIAAGCTNIFFAVLVGVAPTMFGGLPSTSYDSGHNVFCSITKPIGHPSTVHTHEYVTYAPQLLQANHLALRSHGHLDIAQKQQFYTDIHWLDHNPAQWFGHQKHAEPVIPSKSMYLARMEFTAGVPYTNSTNAYIHSLKTQDVDYEFVKNGILVALLALVFGISLLTTDYYYKMLDIKVIEMLTSNDPVFIGHEITD